MVVTRKEFFVCLMDFPELEEALRISRELAGAEDAELTEALRRSAADASLARPQKRPAAPAEPPQDHRTL